MLQKSDVTRIYDTILSIPGMNDKLKISLQVSRKNLLLLSKVIERGLVSANSEDGSVSVLDVIGADSLNELSALSIELMAKSGLAEMNEKLKEF